MSNFKKKFKPSLEDIFIDLGERDIKWEKRNIDRLPPVQALTRGWGGP